MLEQEIKISLTGKRNGDLEAALEEALSRLRDGNSSGMDSNDSGGFSFESEIKTVAMTEYAISETAKNIAANLLVVLGASEQFTSDAMQTKFITDALDEFLDGMANDGDFDHGWRGLVMHENPASMVQVALDELGFADDEEDAISELTDKLNEHFTIFLNADTIADPAKKPKAAKRAKPARKG